MAARQILFSTVLIISSSINFSTAIAQEPAKNSAASEIVEKKEHTNDLTNRDIDKLAKSYVKDKNEEHLATLIDLAANNNQHAAHVLGDLYSKNVSPADGEKAVKYYLQAISSGETNDLIRLGDLYRDGAIVQRNFDKSISYYEQAAKEGLPQGLVRLGAGHIGRKFGNLSRPSTGVKMLEEALNRGELSASTVLANAYFSGTGAPRSSDKALSVLKSAADSGYVPAARSYINALRSGKGHQLPRNLTKAHAALLEYENLISPEEFELEKVVFDAGKASAVSEYSTLGASFNSTSIANKKKLFVMINSVNANAYTWLVQQKLSELKIYTGPINGIMNTATVKSVSHYCKVSLTTTSCVRGPLHRSTARALAENFFIE